MGSPAAVASILARTTARQPAGTVAQDLAASGVPVFPCVPGGKRPLTSRGFHDATTNPSQIAAWWQRHPGANLAVPTGAASGIVVVDVDVHGAVDGYRSFERAHRAGLVEGWQLLMATPSGGMHAYYSATRDREQRSWQAARAGIDFRGDGGYIVIPPSTVSQSGQQVPYRVRRINTEPGTMLDAEALREFLDPRPTPHRSSGREVEQSADVSRLAAWVAARGEGERNRGLFWAACRLAETGVPAPEALDVLSVAASRAGLGEREITATVRSAYRTAQPRPRPSSPVRRGSPPGVEGWFAHDGPAVRASSPLRGLA